MPASVMRQADAVAEIQDQQEMTLRAELAERLVFQGGEQIVK